MKDEQTPSKDGTTGRDLVSVETAEELCRTLATLCRAAGISDQPNADGQWTHLLEEIVHLREVAEDAERAHQFLDECYIGGTGTEPLVDRIAQAIAMPVVLTPAEAAKLLQVSESTVKDLARRGALPGAFKTGKSWRINAYVLQRWMRDDIHGA